MRDLAILLVIAALAIASFPRSTPFLDRPVLAEIAASSVPELAQAAMRRLDR
jgi:hypothetical protein